jgi:hypothetical protein
MSNSPSETLLMTAEANSRSMATAIGDAELEDFVAQLMFSQGWSIVHRSLGADSLQGFLGSNPESKYVLIHTSDFMGGSDTFFDTLVNNRNLTLINIDGISANSHALMSHIRQQLRAPLIQTETHPVQSPLKIVRQQNIVVTGTAGAPGRSTIARALARHFVRNLPVELYDADTQAPICLALMKPGDLPNLAITEIDISIRPTELPPTSRLRVVDLGALGKLASEVTDRRWQANLRTNVMEKSMSSIYVVSAHDLGLKRLAEFIAELPMLINKSNLRFVLNKAGSGRADKELVARFESLVHGYQWGKVSTDYSLNSAALPFALRESRFTKEIAKIASLVKSD